MGGIEVLRQLRAVGTAFPVVVINRPWFHRKRRAAMKEGAYDFITKPLDANHFEIVVRKALESEALKRNWELLAAETDSRHRLIVGEVNNGRSGRHGAQGAASSATVLLLGESGTGEGNIRPGDPHWSSAEASRLSAINCVGLAKELLESEPVRP